MRLDQYVALLEKASVEELTGLGVQDNFAIFFRGDVDASMNALIAQGTYVPGERDVGHTPSGLVHVQFYRYGGGGFLTVPLPMHRLAKSNEGLFHLDKQTKNYSSSITLHPGTLQEFSREHQAAMADVIKTVAKHILTENIPACMPTPASQSFRIENGLVHIDYEKIVYHDP